MTTKKTGENDVLRCSFCNKDQNDVRKLIAGPTVFIGVETEGIMKNAMDLNLRLRTGLRVLFLVKEFTAENPESLYRNIHAIPWEEIISPSGYFSITSTVDTPTIDNTRYASQ